MGCTIVPLASPSTYYLQMHTLTYLCDLYQAKQGAIARWILEAQLVHMYQAVPESAAPAAAALTGSPTGRCDCEHDGALRLAGSHLLLQVRG